MSLCVLSGVDCGMRTAQQVKRINKRFTGPFLGLSEHNAPEMIGPVNASDCNNVLMVHGRIQQRFALTDIGLELTSRKARHVLRFRQRLSSPSLDPVTYETISVVLADNLGEAGNDWFYVLLSADLGAWTTGVILSSTDDGGRLTLMGLLGRGNAAQSIPAYNSMIYVLSGGDILKKLPGNDPWDTVIGIAPPTALSVTTATPLCTNFPSNADIAVSLCDRLQAPVASTFQHPGQESNSIAQGSLNNMNTLSIEFTAYDPTGTFWTHARVYVKLTGETTYKLMGNFPRHSDFSETGDFPVMTNPSGFVWHIPLNYTEATAGTLGNGHVASADAYDFRPTRNLVPINMHHFAFYNGRGYWANRDDNIVHYSDIFNPLSGGHPESLSGDFLAGFNGPITLLAEYNNSLVIGTPSSLYRVTGQVSSHTNATQETSGTIGVTPNRQVPIPGSTGPPAGGYGNYIIVENLLYFVTLRGLEFFDGAKVVDVSAAIRQHANFAAADFDRATLAYDHINGFIFLAAAPDMWVYHTRLIDAESGVGTWTFWDKADRSHEYYAVGSLNGEDPPVLLGSWNPANSRGQMSTLATEVETTSESRKWSWTSGEIDLGVPDRRKRWYTLTVHGADDTANVLHVAYSIDGGSFIDATADFLNNTTLKFHINGYGRRLRVRFEGLTSVSTNNARIFGFDIEAELVDWF